MTEPYVSKMLRGAQRDRVTQDPIGESRTKQSFQDETDLNRIMKRYRDSGVPPVPAPGRMLYGDFSSGDDFKAVLDRVHDAERQFMALPSFIRDHVGNDQGELLDLVTDPGRREEAEELGLLPRLERGDNPPVDPPAPSPAVGDPAQPTPEVPADGGGA